MLNAFWAIGACFEVVLAYLIMETLGWRVLLAISAVPAAMFCAACVVGRVEYNLRSSGCPSRRASIWRADSLTWRGTRSSASRGRMAPSCLPVAWSITSSLRRQVTVVTGVGTVVRQEQGQRDGAAR